MRVGFFGGTFNPPHNGHIFALKTFISEARLDKVLVVPTFIPPHKSIPKKYADFTHRLNMCRLAFENTAGCEVIFSDIEKKIFEETGEKSYTCATLRKLISEEYRLCIYMGSDMFITLDEWKNPDFIFGNTEIWVMNRGENADCKISEFKQFFEKKYPFCKINIINQPPSPASSTQIRDGNTDLLPLNVKTYISEQGLYNDFI